MAFIRGRIGFELPAWFIEGREAGADRRFSSLVLLLFRQDWKGPAISYIGRDERGGEAFLAQVRQQAEKLVREMAA
ncbi:hypothetical protein DMI69_13250 [Escherichia coli]|nr:hypothetical protein [Escherichia coli]